MNILDDEIKEKIAEAEIIPENVSSNLENILGEKRGRGRHPKDCDCEKCKAKRTKTSTFDESKEKDKNDFADSISEAGSFLLEFINPRLPNPQPVNAIEKAAFNNGLRKVALKYFDYIGKYDAEMSMLLGLGIFLAPRLRKKKKETVIQKDDLQTE